MKDLLKSIDGKKLMGLALAIGGGVMTVVSSLADQKKDAEFDAMKEAIKELQEKN